MDRGGRCLASLLASKSLFGVVTGCAPVDHILAYREGCFFSSHSWHFLTVPPYSQYYYVCVSTLGSTSTRLWSRMNQPRGVAAHLAYLGR